ncbi:MAG: hypothetical protein FWD47_08585 [Treponema sp.]|nr:hypothetical protein [Treponema sp.]
MANLKTREKIPTLVKLSLFISSYFPLFLIIILRQIEQNITYFNFGGLNLMAIKLFLSKFGISIFLGIISFFGLIGLYLFMKNTKDLTSNNGHNFVITNIQNKNTESIGYIATYLLPFVLQTYSSLFDILQMVLLLSVMYIIYTHSNLIVVNPILNFKYSLYELEFYNEKSPEIRRNGIFIVNCHYLEIGDNILAKKLNANIFYGTIREEENE